ncbi:hypothetical protein M0811_11094 [Anaeramoeba ignava]|uniref:Band 7 domain-containing protein n=1 Tax=Anaeramoeba ignava TaxID=1746090 RepID=A0A9Q0LCM4_ANAIG|nr:hypothetical protein M0811_11094 [Anaeramoeba ignava]
MENKIPVGAYIGFFIFIFLVLVVLCILFCCSCHVVKHSEVMILERWGKYKKTMLPGLYFINPFCESPRKINWRFCDSSGSYQRIVHEKTNRIDIREHVIVFGKQPVISRDTVSIEIDALVYYQISDPKLAVYSVQNLPDAIELLAQTSLRNIMANLTFDECFSSRELINNQLKQQIERDANRWGVIIHRCEVYNILPPQDIVAAMESQIREERERRAAILLADGARESEVIRSRGTAAKIVLMSEGFRTASIQESKGFSEAKVLLAKAEARSLTAIREAIQDSKIKATDYFLAVHYLQAVTSTLNTNSSATLFLVPQDILDKIATIADK